ncbi:MAG: hypothetical protein AAGA58_00035 [Verrucomicrobiota bacterium]
MRTRILICLASLVSGYFAPAAFSPSRETTVTEQKSFGQETSAPTADHPSVVRNPIGTTSAAPSEQQIPSPRILDLEDSFVEKVISLRLNSDRALERIGIEPEHHEWFRAREKAFLGRIMELEAEHAEVVENEKGRVVTIAPFPALLEEALLDLEKELRQILPDDRAAVAAKLVAYTDSWKFPGRHKREVFFEDRINQRKFVAEKFFKESGQHFAC